MKQTKKQNNMQEAHKDHKTVITIKCRRRTSKKTVALIAHDAKKMDIVMFANENRPLLSQCDIIATGATGRVIAEKTGLSVKRMLSGPDGGDLQIGGLIASGEVDLVIFLRDPLTAQPHEPDISALLRVCDAHNTPLATNLTSANILLRGMLRPLEKFTTLKSKNQLVRNKKRKESFTDRRNIYG